jgi:MFS-type transporter involved in bile tolerance (Atg22 family)
MVGRFAALIGPLLWTVIVDALGWGRPAAILSLCVLVLISIVIIRGVNDGRTAWEPHELGTASANG